MLPGKKYKPEDILRILRRRYWLVLIPFAIISATTAVVARKLPDRFRSTALVLVVGQKVPEEYVKPTVTTRIEDRLAAIQATILSRTRLEQTIEQFNLYPEERKKGIMEDVVQRMRLEDIHVELKSGDAFTVSYDGSSPYVVQKVCESITSSFIQESLQDRELLAQSTDQFLEGTLEENRHQLVEQENKLAAYKSEHKGELPSQLESNLQALSGVQQRLTATLEAIRHNNERRLNLESTIRELEAQAPGEDVVTAPAVSVDPATGSVTGGTTQMQLAYAQNQVNILLMTGKTELYPDVKKWRKIIQQLNDQLEKEATQRPVSATEAVKVSPIEQARRDNLRAAKTALDGLDRQTKELEENQKDLVNLGKTYQAKIDAVPQRETEMTELNRDYATLSAQYAGMRAKKEESRIAARLETRQLGDQFKLLDAARVPERPISPNRPLLNTLGVFFGLGIGLGLVALLEYRDASFKTDEEVTHVLSLPVLAVVPLMQAEPDRRSALRRKVLVSVALGTAVLGCLAVLGWTYVR
jgi:protein tyrosine kinase modulator